MKTYCYIFGLLLLCSCNYFENKKIHATDDLVQEKLLEVDKTSVDKYPVFESCETENSNSDIEKSCFITTLSQYISHSFSEEDLILSNELDASFQATIEVTNSGNVNIINLEITPLLKEQIPNITELVTKSILDLPEIKPAYKKTHSGELIAVTTQFTIPIRVLGSFSEESGLD